SPASPCATIQYAHNQAAAGDAIQIAAGTYVGQAILNRSITLQGADAQTTILDGNGDESAVQLFDAASSLTIRHLTIRNGGAYGISSGGATLIEEAIIRDNNPPSGNHGSGVRVWGPTTIRHTSIYSNSGLYGGGIDVSGPLTVTHSVVYGNAAENNGGGIHLGNNATVLIENSTISGNQSAFSGGGIGIGAPGATLDLRHVTITANQAGGSNTVGGVSGYNTSTPITMSHTIIANNLGDHQCSEFNGAWQSLGYNLSSDGTCHLTGTGDLPNSNPLLGSLADNGGDTLTHAIGPTSPALDAGDNATCAATDQRGRVRPYDGDGDSTATCDMGAYEYGSTDTPPPQTTRYVATTGNDSGNNCLNEASPCATIQHAVNQAFGGETVQIAAGTYVENVTIAESVILQGAGAVTTIVDGGQAGRVIQMAFLPAYDLTIRDLSLRNGKGGIQSSSGRLWLESSRVYNNDSSGEPYNDGGGLYLWGSAVISNTAVYNNSGRYGGGVYATGPLTMTNSAIYANTASESGGGVHSSLIGGGPVTLQNSTISGNMASVGGGLDVVAAGTAVTLRHVTIAHNQTAVGSNTPGGLRLALGVSVSLANNIITANGGSSQCGGSTALTSLGGNLSSDSSCGLTDSSDQPDTDALLGPLQDNGGDTVTRALLSGSPAVDAANGTHCLPTDQRGVARPSGAACDSGAYEADGSEPPPSTQYPVYLPMIIR
ncbi:MAG: choice-of-anchor Q domain-containing protein, partial [Caldilineaceae bacterium]